MIRDSILDKRRNIHYVYRMKTDIETAKDEFDADELNLISLAQEYNDAHKARTLMEKLLWPNGPVCPHCKNTSNAAKGVYPLTPQATSQRPRRTATYFGGECRTQT